MQSTMAKPDQRKTQLIYKQYELFPPSAAIRAISAQAQLQANDRLMGAKDNAPMFLRIAQG